MGFDRFQTYVPFPRSYVPADGGQNLQLSIVAAIVLRLILIVLILILVILIVVLILVVLVLILVLVIHSKILQILSYGPCRCNSLPRILRFILRTENQTCKKA